MVATRRSTAAAKVKIEKEGNEGNGGDHTSINPPKIEEEGPSFGNEDLAEKAMKLTPGLSKGRATCSVPNTIFTVNRRRLTGLLQKLTKAHNWKEASGVLSVLLRATPRGSSFAEDRRNFLVAMEIHKRLGVTSGYHSKIKKMCEIWMNKLTWMQKNPKKRYSVQMELALFYLSQGNIEEAHHATKLLRARLLESFRSSPTTIISSCYEEALKRDPACNLSLERLIKMHKSGNYGTILLLEMITLHLDAADGKSGIWGELASCFQKILTATIPDYEDRISSNVRRDPTSILSSRKIPTAFIEGQARKTWKVRCRWWLTRHFSKNAYVSEMQAGDWELLTSKAVCASHLYGPENDYVKAVLSSLQEGGDNDRITFLHAHLRNPMKLHEFLNKPASQTDGFH